MADKLMRTFVVMSFFLALALFSGCDTHGINLNGADNNGQIAAKPGDTLILTLDSNPTTGYSWQVMEIDNAVLVQNGDPEYKQSAGSEELVGAGGTEIFHFNVVGTETTTLELGYMRSWESVPPIETFTIEVVVQ